MTTPGTPLSDRILSREAIQQQQNAGPDSDDSCVRIERFRAVCDSHQLLIQQVAALTQTVQAQGQALEWVQEFADEPCEYRDECPSNARHYRCKTCRARDVLSRLQPLTGRDPAGSEK